MASNLIPTKQVLQQVRPLLSVDKAEARRRVLHLYKAWIRAIPENGKIFQYSRQYAIKNMPEKHASNNKQSIELAVQQQRIPKTELQCKEKVREMFLKHKNVSDIRVIDMLVIKGKQHLDECVNGWSQATHLMRFWSDTLEPKPTDFLSKFISGKN